MPGQTENAGADRNSRAGGREPHQTSLVAEFIHLFQVNASADADVYKSDRRLNVRFQIDGQNLTNVLDVTAFGGLFSENAIGPSRSVAVRLTDNELLGRRKPDSNDEASFFARRQSCGAEKGWGHEQMEKQPMVPGCRVRVLHGCICVGSRRAHPGEHRLCD